MGMFDYVKPSEPIVCPKCKSNFTELQTKDLVNLMDEYKEGETFRRQEGLRVAREDEKDGGIPLLVPDGTYKNVPHPTYQTIFAYDYCSKCEAMVYQLFRFDTKGKLKRYKKPYIEGTQNESK